ncbi:putative ribonuclease H protein [Sesbania bispinosa]|nr:putative ribonuclease H protein [Sesbania bispinosa]
MFYLPAWVGNGFGDSKFLRVSSTSCGSPFKTLFQLTSFVIGAECGHQTLALGVTRSQKMSSMWLGISDSKHVWNILFPIRHHNFLQLQLRSWIEVHATTPNGPLFLSTLWWFWRWRNNITLDEDKWNLTRVERSILSSAQEFRLCSMGKELYNCFNFKSHHVWCPPPSGFVKVNSDEWVMGASGFSTAMDSLHAELLAIKLGFQCVWHQGMLAEITLFLECDWTVDFSHVLREANTSVDGLARLV